VKSKFDISIIVPCYNEEENLKTGVLNQVFDYLKGQKQNWQLIISDDGSTDNSLSIARKFQKTKSKSQKGFKNQIKVLANKHGGKPWAVWQGIKAADGRIILFTDMDQSTPLNQLEKLLPWFEKGYDVVIGSRGRVRQDAPLIRKLMAYAFLSVRRIMLLPNIIDTQCGFKAMRRSVALEIFPKLQFFQEQGKKVSGWRVSAFDVEMLFICQKLGYKIREVAVNWQDRDAAAEQKNKSFIKESKNMLSEILRVKINDLFGKYSKK